jgi:hypothetical protein
MRTDLVNLVLLEHLHRFDLKLKTYTGMIAHLSPEFIVVEIMEWAACWTIPAMTLLIILT